MNFQTETKHLFSSLVVILGLTPRGSKRGLISDEQDEDDFQPSKKKSKRNSTVRRIDDVIFMSTVCNSETVFPDDDQSKSPI